RRMPRRRTQSTRRGVFLGTLAVVVALALVLVLSVLTSHGTIKTKLGDTEFRAGRVTTLARAIQAGGPLIFARPAGARVDVDIYVQHICSTDTTGWLAFAARAPGQDDRNCTLRWTGSQF